MTNVSAIHSVGSSLIKYLRNTWPTELREKFDCDFELLSTGRLATMTDEPGGTLLSLFLFRVSFNEHLRNRHRPGDACGGSLPMSLDLHYMLTVWSDSPLAEQTVLAWAMQQFYLHPVLNAASLSSEGGWGPDDLIQITPTELSNEDVMRVWDALAPSYRLSVPYVARCVRIEGQSPVRRPVTAQQFRFSTEVGAGRLEQP